MANERAKALAGQFIMDMHTHFLRDDTRLEGFVRSREAVGKAGWNPALAGKPQTLDDLKFANYFKEIYFDSDTKVALISGSGSEEPRDWFLTNEMKADARAKVNKLTGSKRLLSHAIFMPGMPGWMEAVDQAIAELKPDSFKGYTVGDNTNKQLSQAPVAHGRREAALSVLREAREGRARQRLRAQGPLPAVDDQASSRTSLRLRRRARRGQGGEGLAAAQLRHLPLGVPLHRRRRARTGWTQFEQTGRVDWVTDLAEIPAKYGVKNVYGDLGQIFAQSTVAEPRLCAAMMGMLVKGLGADHVVWGTDAIWTGAPQWQIEALRRLEIPEDMQKKYGFPRAGRRPTARSSARSSARTRRGSTSTIAKRRAELTTDRIALARADYEREGPGRTNRRYGYVAKALA